MTPPEIIDTMTKVNAALSAKVEKYYGLGVDRVEKEREYRIAAAQKSFDLKVKGTPATLIGTYVAGDGDVSQKRLEYQIAKVTEGACRESIKTLRGELDALRSELSYAKAERERV